MLKGELPAYVVGSPDAKAAIIVTYDIYGFEGQSRIRLICDQLADSGFYVVLPDFFRGDKWTDELKEAKGKEGLVDWLKTFPWSNHLEKDHEVAVAHAKSHPNVKKVGAAGFCFGGWVG